jgi:cellulose synthase/poly-beta-1,6-N-acetylglucosamine synthase-like glycosyltransferase
MIEILYPAWNRLEFTRKSFETMLANTNWECVSRLVVYDDGSSDGTREYLAEQVRSAPVNTVLITTNGIGPVAIMIDYLRSLKQNDIVFAKIDNDVVLPPGWVEAGLQVLHDDASVDLIGIEALRPLGKGPYTYSPAEYIGGIGFMRSRAFRGCVPTPNGRFGFTKWQSSHEDVKKGWIDPALSVCLLNLMPFEPWSSLSREYIRKGWQRDWPGPLPAEHKALWEWWAP